MNYRDSVATASSHMAIATSSSRYMIEDSSLILEALLTFS